MLLYRLQSFFLAISFAAATNIQAQEDHDHDFQVHEAHVHGYAELQIISHGQGLQIELHSPAMNLVGFEHQASNAEELSQIENSKIALANTSVLFNFSTAECQLLSHEVDFGNLRESSHDDHDDEEHDLHSEVQAQYFYTCSKPDQLVSLTTSILAQFPTIESLQVEWIANGRQGSVELSGKQNTVLFE